MKVIITVFLLLMIIYLTLLDDLLVFFIHLGFCVFLILYVIYASKLKHKIITILSSIFISSFIVYHTGYIMEDFYLKINKPEIEVASFIQNEKYNQPDSKYNYEIQDGLNYEQFKKFEYSYTIGHITHSRKYFSDEYDLVYKHEGKLYFIKWKKLSKNKINLYFYKPNILS